ncbi:MAG: hypothetical protein ACJ8C4_18490 [Gemmataceae bacterium]
MNKFVHVLSWLALIVTLLLTVMWLSIIAAWLRWGLIDTWSAFGFFITAIPTSVGILLLVVLPSFVLDSGATERSVRTSLWLSLFAFSLLLIEIIAIWFIPYRGE